MKGDIIYSDSIYNIIAKNLRYSYDEAKEKRTITAQCMDEHAKQLAQQVANKLRQDWPTGNVDGIQIAINLIKQTFDL